MSSWRFIVHVHTRRSYDCMTTARALVQRAVDLGIDVLAVTDHDTWQGSVDVLRAAHRMQAPVRVVIGSEVYTDQGDLIGLFLKDDIRQRAALKFCREVHEQGGLVLLPHPYRWHHLDDDLLEEIDLIEVFNARTFKRENERAAALAEERGIPALVGPDAHGLAELDLAVNEFPGQAPSNEAAIQHALLHDPRVFHTRSGSIWNEWRSQVVKFVRRPDWRLGYQLARGAARRVVKPGDYRLG